MGSPSLSPQLRDALSILARDLRHVFGTRLHSVVAYGLHRKSHDDDLLHTLALVDRVTFDDLAACAPEADKWERRGLAVPLLISRDEFVRTLDVFPVEYDAIIRDHAIVDGHSAFDGIRVNDLDLRRGIELQAKSHLIHLREGFLESGRDSGRVARLIAASAPAFRRLLANIARLNGRMPDSDEGIADAAADQVGLDRAMVREVFASAVSATPAVDPSALLSRYVAGAEQVWQYVDGWRHR
jgi:hypothetical protein